MFTRNISCSPLLYVKVWFCLGPDSCLFLLASLVLFWVFCTEIGDVSGDTLAVISSAYGIFTSSLLASSGPATHHCPLEAVCVVSCYSFGFPVQDLCNPVCLDCLCVLLMCECVCWYRVISLRIDFCWHLRLGSNLVRLSEWCLVSTQFSVPPFLLAECFVGESNPELAVWRASVRPLCSMLEPCYLVFFSVLRWCKVGSAWAVVFLEFSCVFELVLFLGRGNMPSNKKKRMYVPVSDWAMLTSLHAPCVCRLFRYLVALVCLSLPNEKREQMKSEAVPLLFSPRYLRMKRMFESLVFLQFHSKSGIFLQMMLSDDKR